MFLFFVEVDASEPRIHDRIVFASERIREDELRFESIVRRLLDRPQEQLPIRHATTPQIDEIAHQGRFAFHGQREAREEPHRDHRPGTQAKLVGVVQEVIDLADPLEAPPRLVQVRDERQRVVATYLVEEASAIPLEVPVRPGAS